MQERMFFAYLIIVLLTGLSMYFKDKYINLFSGIINCFVISALFAFRPTDFGADTKNYLAAFEKFSLSAPFSSNNFEPITNVIMFATKSLGFSFIGFQFVLIFLMSIVFFKSCQLVSRNPTLPHSIILLSPFYILLATNIQRQGLAVAFITLSVCYIMALSYRKSAFAALLGFLSHISSVLFFTIAFLILKIHKHVKSVSATLMLCGGSVLILYFFLVDILNLIRPILPDLGIVLKLYSNIDTFLIAPDDGVKVGLILFLDALLILIFVTYLFFLRRRPYFLDSEVHLANQVSLARLALFSATGVLIYLVFSNMQVVARLAFYSWPLVILVAIFMITRVKGVEKSFLYFTLLLFTFGKSMVTVI